MWWPGRPADRHHARLRGDMRDAIEDFMRHPVLLPVCLGLMLTGAALAQPAPQATPATPASEERAPPRGPAPETASSPTPAQSPARAAQSERTRETEADPPLPRIEPDAGPRTDGAEVSPAPPVRPPVLAWLESQGVTLTELGEEGGLRAWLGEARGGQMQVFYVTPDGRHLVAGLMFREGGSNVTAAQLAAMRERFDAERRRIQEQERRMATAQQRLDGGIDRALTSIPAQPSPSADSPRASGQEPAQPPAPSPEQVALRDRVVRAAEATAWFSIGQEGRPVVYLLADPQCPHCHAVWAQLRPRVEAGDILVKVILIGGLPGSEERAISILSRPEPGRVWFAGEGSTTARVAPPPPETSRQFQVARRLLQTNLDFAREMGVRGTPWIAYVDRNGVLRMVEGAVDMGQFLREIR